MQMGVLRLGEVGIELRESHIGYRLPVTAGGFDITVVLMIEGMLLDTIEKRQRIVKGLMITRSPGIFRQAVDGKADGIELLAGVQRLSLIVETPIDTAILLVDEVTDEVVLGIGGRLQIAFVFQHAIGGREGPEDAGIEDCSLLRICMKHLLTVDTPVEPSVLPVYHLGLPERQDVLHKHILHLLTHRLRIHILTNKVNGNSSVRY